jgi:hypothetical protein
MLAFCRDALLHQVRRNLSAQRDADHLSAQSRFGNRRSEFNKRGGLSFSGVWGIMGGILKTTRRGDLYRQTRIGEDMSQGLCSLESIVELRDLN